ncbi:MAG: hypothetical protein D3905_02820 [Candidatus Electrothrix sp. AS4_5]|nr:hypothetical protein [Candidatus Electrothrix gigas]
MNNENSTNQWKALEYTVTAIGINAIFYALIYCFGLISFKAQLNMLGVWLGISYNQEIFREIFINFITSAGPQLALISIIFLPLVTLAFFIQLKIFNFTLTWKQDQPISLLSCALLTIIYIIIFFLYSLPLANQELLLSDAGIKNDYAYLFAVSDYSKFNFFFYYLELLSLFVLLFAVVRLWSSNPVLNKKTYLFFQIFLSLLGSIHLLLIPINYGILFSSSNYYPANIKIKDSQSIRGYPIIQTDKEVVIFVEQDDKNKKKILFKKRSDITEIVFDKKSVNILDTLFKHQLTGKKTMEGKFMKTIIGLTICFFLSFTLVFAQKEQTQKITVKPEEDISFLAKMYPYLIAMPVEKIIETLESLSSALRGDGDDSVTVRSDQLNIWLYDLINKELKQITKNGGYLFARGSNDGDKISYIRKNKLWIMDAGGNNQKIIDERFQYSQLLGWNSISGEYLIVTRDDKLLSLNKKNDSVEELVPEQGKLKKVLLDGFVQLSRKALGGKSISSLNQQDRWFIIEDHEDYDEAKIILENEHILYSPSWFSGDSKIIFVSDMDTVNQKSM